MFLSNLQYHSGTASSHPSVFYYVLKLSSPSHHETKDISIRLSPSWLAVNSGFSLNDHIALLTAKVNVTSSRICRNRGTARTWLGNISMSWYLRFTMLSRLSWYKYDHQEIEQVQIRHVVAVKSVRKTNTALRWKESIDVTKPLCKGSVNDEHLSQLSQSI